jgi:hypothetical protein
MMQGTRASSWPAEAKIGAVMAAAGAVMLLASVISLAFYHDGADAGAGRLSLGLALGALIFIGVPAVITAAWVTVHSFRRYFAWKRTLTPQERVAVDLAEAAVLWSAHLAMQHQHRETQARLSASVMGTGSLNPAAQAARDQTARQIAAWHSGQQ